MTLVTLSEACSSIVDCAHKTAPVDPLGEYFAVGTPAMRGNVINYDDARRISQATFEAWTERMRPAHGDLLLAREAPVGPVVRLPKSANIAPGQRTVLLRPDPDRTDSGYLFYALTARHTQARFLELTSGSTVHHLNVVDVREFQIELPNLSEQRAIAEVLGALDEKIAANSQLTASLHDVLELEAESVWFRSTDGLSPITDYLDFNPRTTPPGAPEPIYVDMKKLPESGSGIADWERRPAKGGARFQNGDTLLARITPCLENRKTGFVDFLEEGATAIGSTEFIVMRTKADFAPPISYFVAVSRDFREHAIQRMVGTSGRQRVSAKDLAEVELPTAPREWLADFSLRAGAQFTFMKSLRAESRTLAETRDALLPHLMSGRLTVRDAEKKVEDLV